MALLHPPEYDIGLFDFCRQDNTLGCEMSDLDQGATRQAFGPVYDDACDVGLTVVGKRETVVYVVNYIQREPGETTIQWWGLIPALLKDRERGLPEIKIWND